MFDKDDYEAVELGGKSGDFFVGLRHAYFWNSGIV